MDRTHPRAKEHIENAVCTVCKLMTSRKVTDTTPAIDRYICTVFYSIVRYGYEPIQTNIMNLFANLQRFPLDSNLITQFSQISKLGHCEFTPKTISMKLFNFFLQLTLISPQSILYQTSAAMATNSAIKYESSYKSKDISKSKFTQFFDDGGTSFKETCDKYNGREESTLEVIHYTTERYKRVADKMQWTWREKFDHYEEILDENTHIYWTTNIIPIFPEHLRNHYGFDMAITRMMNEFARERRARDHILIEEMESSKCRKPKNETVQPHLLRLQRMQTLTNSVNGIRSKVTDNQLKIIFLKSLTITWQTNWVNSGREITESRIDEIKDYLTSLIQTFTRETLLGSEPI